jgi:transcription factor IIIB subunit 2
VEPTITVCCHNLLILESSQLIYFFYPETANLTLEEIDGLFLRDSLKAHHTDEESQSKGHTEVIVEKIG